MAFAILNPISPAPLGAGTLQDPVAPMGNTLAVLSQSTPVGSELANRLTTSPEQAARDSIKSKFAGGVKGFDGNFSRDWASLRTVEYNNILYREQEMQAENIRVGGKTPTARGGKFINQAATEAKRYEMVDAYINVLKDQSIDEISRQELVDMYKGGASGADITETLKKAQEGEGMYAFRKINQADKNYQMATPSSRRKGIL